MTDLNVSRMITMMATEGGPAEFDARNHACLHDALVFLIKAADSDDLPHLAVTPDPEVGWRVGGVTTALWHLLSTGNIHSVKRSSGPMFAFERGLQIGSQSRLRSTTHDAIYLAAQRWAIAETSSKNVRQVSTSLMEARRDIVGTPRQLSDSRLRHCALSTN